jgi:plasmid stability protein
MPITIELPEGAEQQLAIRAAKAGQSKEALASQAVLNLLAEERTIAEILAPFRQDVAESGMTEEELDRFFQEVRQEVWDEEQGQRP